MNRLAVASLERAVELARQDRRKALAPELEKAAMLLRAPRSRLPRWFRVGVGIRLVGDARSYYVHDLEYEPSLREHRVVILDASSMKELTWVWDGYATRPFPWRRITRVSS